MRDLVGNVLRSEPSSTRPMSSAGRRDWTQELFVDHADLYLPFLEDLRERGEQEARRVAQVLRRSGVRPGSRILDLCCGIGRHAVPLARRGYDVVGLDLSPRYVAAAKRCARNEGVSGRTRFVEADFRKLAGPLAAFGPFDGVVSGFTSIGYYGMAADRRALAAVARRTRPGGVLVLWLTNKDWILRHFQPHGWSAAGDTVLLEERTYDGARSYMRNRWEFFRRRGRALRSMGVFSVDHRVYAPPELRALLTSAGWTVRSLAANFRGDRIDVEHRKGAIVAVAERS